MSEENNLRLFNTLTHRKELFTPLHAPFVGMYVCGPTVYGEPHLGHARPAIVFDLLFRHLKFLGYKVRYVRNITDVGHLEHDADEGEDKIAKKARIERLEPMEVAQYYMDAYHDAMDRLNVLRPSIEPRASGHIIEQIGIVQQILDKGYAYISEGSVYFDVPKFDKDFGYGKLSGRVLEELFANTRTLDGQEEKHHPADFALWKKAAPEHIMRWPSPWSDGFPGWHVECSAMSTKYLGKQFDIHGGGMDLMFPHHESEICQSRIANGVPSARYWIHNNMITINGQKMGKSLGNFITLNEFFNGSHKDAEGKEMLEQAYSPMTIRFFILQAHYRSTVDFSNEALQSAQKGFEKLMQAHKTLQSLKPSNNDSVDVNAIYDKCLEAMNDDLNSAMVIAELFELTKIINSVKDGHATLTAAGIERCKDIFNTFAFDILGLKDEYVSDNQELVNHLIQMILDIRQQAKATKNWAVSDQIRDELQSFGIAVKDGKEGASWELK